MHRALIIAIAFCIGIFAAIPRAHAEGAPFLGVELGWSGPTNDNYASHVENGMSAMPYAGYMFNDYLGIEIQGQVTSQYPDQDHRSLQTFGIPGQTGTFKYTGFNHENQMTTVLGLTGGPRLNVPLGDFLTLYATVQGGGYQGVSGRLDGHGGPGFNAGGGLDVNLTKNFAIGAFGRWNHAYIAPRPFFLSNQVAEDQGPSDARWVVAGIGLKYTFAQPPPPPPPPRVAQAPPPPPPPPPPVKKKIVLRSVHFDFDKSTIRPDAVPVLNEAVQTLKQEGSVDIVVEGHTDSVGTDAYNQKLSERRAKAVREYLVNHGVSANRITTKGYGESQPVATNETAEGRQQNRRVELHVE